MGITTSYAIDAAVLYASLGLPGSPVIVSLEKPQPNARLIPGSVQVDLAELSEWATCLHPDRSFVVYCESGDALSHRAVELLRSRGWEARYLAGGSSTWRSAGLATVRARAEFNVPGGSRWVTRERPKIDRLACPWLVRRFIDPQAQFFYTPAHRVRSAAETLNAQPYDIADVTFSHRGSKCSFDAFLAEFDLHDPSIDAVAEIVRAADTGELAQSPQSHGLLAISLGLSAIVSDDFLLLEQAMPMYDALYAWSKKARTESHSWPKQPSPAY